MAGTKSGGRQAAATNKSKYGDDFYKRIGTAGGAAGHTGGFHANRELASTAGRKGGLKSRRGKAAEYRFTAPTEPAKPLVARPSLLKRLLHLN